MPQITASQRLGRGAFLLLIPGLALAGQLLQGSQVRIHYGDGGLWNDPDTAVQAGLQFYDTGEAQWMDISWPGIAWSRVFIGYTQDAAEYTILSSAAEPDWSVERAVDTATADRLIAVHRFTSGDLRIDRVETWAVDGAAIWTEWTLTNTGIQPISALRLTQSLDADPDSDALSNPQPLTYNDTLDLDSDTLSEWVQSEGVITGVTAGFGMCDTSAQEVGHHASSTFLADPDLPLSDEGGSLQDYTMNLRHTVGTLQAGDVVTFSTITALGSSPTQAQDAYLDAREEACGLIDFDQDDDGFDALISGGDDCNDFDSGVHPGAKEVWYDGVDQDCDGNDTDADGDGFEAQAAGGADCDDADDAVSPDAVEVWYDGTDQDCDDNDMDADGDGYVIADDCDDTDASVSPGAAEVWYDGADQNCDGADDYDADGDGVPHEDYSGEDCNDFDAAVYPGAVEVWYDGTDADCDGASDYDADGDGWDAARYDGEDCHDADPSRWECKSAGSGRCGTAGSGGGGLLLAVLALGVRRRRSPRRLAQK